MKILPEFYESNDVVFLSRMLLGKYLFTQIDGQLTGGRIVETEAYRGPEDRGSHAHNNRYTPRTQVMFSQGGVSYVYLCYGIHYLFNIISGDEGNPHAILVRGIEPVTGIETMLVRRNMTGLAPRITAGPGAVAQALGLNKTHNALSLQGQTVWLEDRGELDAMETIITGPRVGMNFEGPWHSIPWRFSLKGNRYVSKAK